jgi:exodeoxyribonuclease V alpha subunit
LHLQENSSMQTFNDVHLQFASFFKNSTLQPYAYLVSKKLSEGHICINLDDIEKDWEQLPPYFAQAKLNVKYLLNDNLVSKDIANKQPFILFGNRLYLQRYEQYEREIFTQILSFLNQEVDVIKQKENSIKEQSNYLRSLFNRSINALPNWQFAAVISAFINQFTIITGGPGTGKTTTVAKILALLFQLNPNLKVALAAPTGKAAARMAESLKNASEQVDEKVRENFMALQPSTLHRLLGYIPDSPYFKHGKSFPLIHDVVIIDESSMIDAALFAKLLNAIGSKTKLILLGDKDQLASVEAGSLFGDLCLAKAAINHFSIDRLTLINETIANEDQLIPKAEITNSHALQGHIIELKYSHRFKSDEGIGKLSKAIINNEEQALADFIHHQKDTQVAIYTDYNAKAFEDFIAGYQDYIQEKDIQKAFQKLNKLRVLCATREGEQGLYSINKKIEDFLRGKNLLSTLEEFYEHRPIMVTSNNYQLNLFNGDIGIIRKDENGILRAHFESSDGEIFTVLPGLLSKVETVFAMTIHKSQGSEFSHVLISLPPVEEMNILTRELLYTGVTRAKNKVVILGSEALILQTAKAQVQRASGIQDRFLTLATNY